MSYACEDPKVGYIQGMNVILSGILFHVKDEIKSFAVFRNIIINVRSMYLQGKSVHMQTSNSATSISHAYVSCWRSMCMTFGACLRR